MSALIFCASLVSCVYVSGKTVRLNLELRDIYAKKIEVEKEVTRLKYDDVKLSSLESLKQRSISLGFVPLNSQLLTVDISQSLPLALGSVR